MIALWTLTNKMLRKKALKRIQRNWSWGQLQRDSDRNKQQQREHNMTAEVLFLVFFLNLDDGYVSLFIQWSKHMLLVPSLLHDQTQ